MRRRDFMTLLGGAAVAWPIAVRAQQTAVPVVGFLSAGSPESDASRLVVFRQGLSQFSYIDGRNVVIEYRGMQGHYDLLPAFISDFIRRPVSVIVVNGNTPGAYAAKAATSKIPIVFSVGVDPVEAGLVASFSRPGGNVTGISNLQGVLGAKRLELLHELLPGATLIAVLVNPSNPPYTEYGLAELRNAATSLGVELHLLNASSVGEIDAAFATLPQIRPGALVVSSEFFLSSRFEQVAALASKYAVPAIHSQAEAAEAGGLMSYGPVSGEIGRQLGIYAGRILKGVKPEDLPVTQSTKVDLVINLKAAKALGITFPLTLLGRADEVIE
jgi:putative ABC transport system substrate-binding protein